MADKLPLAAMERILKKGEDNIRVSDPAKEELRIILEQHAEQIAKKAASLAIHAGRRTIKAEDIRLAVK